MLYYTSLIYFVPLKPELSYSSGLFTGPQQNGKQQKLDLKKWVLFLFFKLDYFGSIIPNQVA